MFTLISCVTIFFFRFQFNFSISVFTRLAPSNRMHFFFLKRISWIVSIASSDPICRIRRLRKNDSFAEIYIFFYHWHQSNDQLLFICATLFQLTSFRAFKENLFWNSCHRKNLPLMCLCMSDECHSRARKKIWKEVEWRRRKKCLNSIWHSRIEGSKLTTSWALYKRNSIVHCDLMLFSIRSAKFFLLSTSYK